MNAAKRVVLPAELPAAVKEVWFVLAQRTVVVGATVVGVAVVKLVSAPEQRFVCIGLGRYSKRACHFSFTATIVFTLLRFSSCCVSPASAPCA